jgi:hypothetical protein
MPRTFTAAHPSGVTFTSADLATAALLTGWGWRPCPDEDRPVGVDVSGARTKGDLVAYAADLVIDMAGTKTRADIEQRISAHHEEHS